MFDPVTRLAALFWNIEALNKWVLAAAAVVGTVGIGVLKLGGLGLGEESALIVLIAWPAFILVIYLLAMRIANERAVYEIIGDNCYYLGFVFTLVSLAVTLYLLHPSGGADASGDVPIRQVISGFGVALSSTIVGIVLRVLMLRMAPDATQKDSEARRDLDLAVRDFRVHLRRSVEQLKHSSIETAQILAEQRDATRKALADGAEEHRQTLKSGAVALAETAEAMKARFSEHQNALREAVDGMIETLSERQGEIQEALTDGTKEHRQALKSSAAALADSAEAVKAQFSEHLDTLRDTVDGTVKTLSEWQGPAQEALERSADRHRQALEGSADSLRQLQDRAVQAVSDYQEETQRQAQLSRETHERTGAAAETARKELEAAKVLIESVGSLAEDSRNIDAVFSGLIDRLGSVEGAIVQKLEPAIAQIGESAGAISATLADSSGKLKAAADRFEQAAARTVAADAQTGIARAVEQLGAANGALADALGKLDNLADKQTKAAKRRGPFGMFQDRDR